MLRPIKLTLFILSTGFWGLTHGQADIKLSSFFLAPLTYNPAYAGSYDGFTASSIYSSQWVGFDGAPNTLFLNAHSALKGTKTGVGIEIIHDKIGVTTQTQILGNFAYHLKITRGWKLSMGIKAGINKYMVDYNQLRIDDPTELNVLSGELNQNGFGFGTGLFAHNEEFFFGVGVPDLLENNYYDFDKNTIAKSSRNYYFSTGYSLALRDNVILQPAILTRFTKGAPPNTLIAGTLNWDEKFYGSINIDLKSSVGGFFGIRFADQFLIGYSYDTSINSFNTVNNGIHSLFLNFRRSNNWLRKRCGCYTF